MYSMLLNCNRAVTIRTVLDISLMLVNKDRVFTSFPIVVTIWMVFFSKRPVVVTIRTGFPNSSHLLPLQKPPSGYY